MLQETCRRAWERLFGIPLQLQRIHALGQRCEHAHALKGCFQRPVLGCERHRCPGVECSSQCDGPAVPQ